MIRHRYDAHLADAFSSGPSGPPPPRFPLEVPEGYPVLRRNGLAQYLYLHDCRKFVKERKKTMWRDKYISLFFFPILLLTPVFPVLAQLNSAPWLVPILWTFIVILIIMWIEYYHRLEVWWILFARGLILRMDEKKWFLHVPVWVAIAFAVTVCLVVGFATANWLTGVLTIPGVIFIVFVAKDFVMIEKGTTIETLNELVIDTERSEIVDCAGFAVVHKDNLLDFVMSFKDVFPSRYRFQFTWDLVYQLHPMPQVRSRPWHIFWGTHMRLWLGGYRDLLPELTPHPPAWYPPSVGFVRKIMIKLGKRQPPEEPTATRPDFPCHAAGLGSCTSYDPSCVGRLAPAADAHCSPTGALPMGVSPITRGGAHLPPPSGLTPPPGGGYSAAYQSNSPVAAHDVHHHPHGHPPPHHGHHNPHGHHPSPFHHTPPVMHASAGRGY
eukprot:TRINITY_DN4307_c0_g1_i1.p1 TRINITY_DN4307_c0_g1~~TRINITY_DN4307_c0_g1_i1.p1  ORF type:complete len:438 (-),score=47.00 TRINITY_DN4307_c0_g1_i1:503-1816(-)